MTHIFSDSERRIVRRSELLDLIKTTLEEHLPVRLWDSKDLEAAAADLSLRLCSVFEPDVWDDVEESEYEIDP